MKDGLVLLATASLLTVSLAGCLGDPSGQAPAIPYPTPGTRYVYVAEDGDRLNVTVTGVRDRLTGGLGIRAAVVLDWTLHEVNEGRWSFQEAVAVEDGTIVQQVAFCAAKEIDPETGEKRCYDDRSFVSFAGSGIPGAFGIGPLWGTSLGDPNASAWTFSHPLTQGPATERTLLDVGDDGCANVTTPRPTEPRTPARVLETTVTAGDVVVCDGHALPVAFDPVRAPRFELRERHVPEDAEPTGEADADPREPGPGVGTREVHLPLMVADPGDDPNLTTREAHDQALQRSEAYRESFEERDGVLVHSRYQWDGYASTGDVVSSERHVRRLIVVDRADRLVDVRIHKTTRDPGPDTYALIDEEVREGNLSPPGEASVDDRQASVTATAEVGEAFTGTPVSRGSGVRTSVFLKGTSELGRDPITLDGGYAIVSWHREPGQPRGRPGTTFQVPYETAVHGPSARVLWADVPPDRMPLDGPPAGTPDRGENSAPAPLDRVGIQVEGPLP